MAAPSEFVWVLSSFISQEDAIKCNEIIKDGQEKCYKVIKDGQEKCCKGRC